MHIKQKARYKKFCMQDKKSDHKFLMFLFLLEDAVIFLF